MVHRTAPTPQPLLYLAGKRLTAFDHETGRVAWQYDARARLVRVLYAVERVFVLDADSMLYCLLPADGRSVGQIQMGSPSAWGAALLPGPQGGLYVATTEGVWALDPNGRVLWKFQRTDETSGGSGGVIPGLALPEGAVQPDFKE